MMDIKVSLYQTLPDGWKIFLCRRYFVNYDKATDSWIAPEAKMGVNQCMVRKDSLRTCTSIGFEENYDIPTTVPLNNNNSNSSSDVVEICRISELPKSDPVAVNSPRLGQTDRSILQIGDILLDAPDVVSQLSHSFWQKGTLQQAIRAKTNAINAGRAFYVMYFAQPPNPLANVAAAVRKNATTTTTPQATTLNACADTNNCEAILYQTVSRVFPHRQLSPTPRTMIPQMMTVPPETKNNNATKGNTNNNAAAKRRTSRLVEPKPISTLQHRPRTTKNSLKTNGSAQIDLESLPGQNSHQQPVNQGLTTYQDIESIRTTAANNMMQQNINDTTSTNNNNNNSNNSCTQPLAVEPEEQIPVPFNVPTTAVVNVTPTQTSATAANNRVEKNTNNSNNSCTQPLAVEPEEQIPVPFNVPTTAVVNVMPTQTNATAANNRVEKNTNNSNNSCIQPLAVEPEEQIPVPFNVPTTAVVNVTPTQTNATAANNRVEKYTNNSNNSCTQPLAVEPEEQIPVPFNVPTTAVVNVTPTQTSATAANNRVEKNTNNSNNSCTQPLAVEPEEQIPVPFNVPTTAVVNVMPTQTSATAANNRIEKNTNNSNNSCTQPLAVEPEEQIPVPFNVPTTAVVNVTPTQANGILISTPPDSSMPMPPEQLNHSETIHVTISPIEAEPVGFAIPDNVLSVDQQLSAHLEPNPPLTSTTTTTAKRRAKRKIINQEDKGKRSKVNHHGDLFGKMKPKHINDQLTQQASMKHAQTVLLLDQCKELATKLVEYDTVAGENALKVFHDWTLPAIPTKITPPQEINDRAEMYQRVGEYHAELEKQNVELEGLIGSMDQWNQRLAEAVQNWKKQSEKHQQCQKARDEVHKRVHELEQELAKAKELFQNAVVEEADATREEKHCFEVTLDCFKSKM